MNTKHRAPYNKEITFEINLLHPKYLLTWISLGLLFLITKLPLSFQYSIGKLIGLIFFFLNKQRKRIAVINLNLCFPQLKKSQVDLLVKENFKNLGIGFFEMGLSWWSKEERLKNLITEYSNKELLQDSIENKEGILVLIKHSTHLELDLRLISTGSSMGGMYRPQKNKVINYFMRRSRNSYLTWIVSNAEARRGIVWIKKGLKFFYAADQDYGKKVSEFIPFFGNDAATVKLPGNLALQGITVVFADVKRQKYGYKINLHKFKKASSRNAFLMEMNKYYEKAISEAPEEYLWVHRRFKNVLGEKQNIYPYWEGREKRRKRNRSKKVS